MEKSVTLVPFGGIGNRISAVESAVRLCGCIGAKLRVLWFRDWGMKAGFGDLFSPIDGVEFPEPSLTDRLVNDWPRKRNLYIPAPIQGMKYQRCFYGDRRYIGTEDLLGARSVYIASCYSFFTGEEDFTLFRPSEKVAGIAARLTGGFGRRTVGIHVRRTDHAESAAKSPTKRFMDVMRSEPEDTVFYLASDSREVKEEMAAAFPGRMLYDTLTLSRGSIEAEMEAAGEMFALSRCDRVIGSYNSSFGLRAASLGHVPFDFITDL